MNGARCAFRVLTPGAPGAVAIIQLSGDVEGAMRAIGCAHVAPGSFGLRRICGVDEGVVARWAGDSAQLMPHGGVAVVRAIVQRLRESGLTAAEGDDPAREYPEAADKVEALMLAALARAPSELAIDLLLDQPRRWRAWDGAAPTVEAILDASRVLNRLIEPALVVAAGPANVGKSTLANALADREVAIVADEPGTTRDHVGVTIDMGGLVVRWLDTPGLRSGDVGTVEAGAVELAIGAMRSADLIVLCGDAERTFPDLAAIGLGRAASGGGVLRVATRVDLGEPAPGGGAPDVRTAARSGDGLGELVAAVKGRLLPQGAVPWEGPWAFDGRLLGG